MVQVQMTRSAQPGFRAKAIAAVAILLAGACGGLIGYGLGDVTCSGPCTYQPGLGALGGAALGAVGVAIVASLALRAMHEWRAGPPARRTQAGDAPGSQTS